MTNKILYDLPKKVIFCKKTLISNQRPNSAIEFLHTKNSKKKTLNIDKNGISDAWKISRDKKNIDYQSREKQLLKLRATPRQITRWEFAIEALLAVDTDISKDPLLDNDIKLLKGE